MLQSFIAAAVGFLLVDGLLYTTTQTTQSSDTFFVFWFAIYLGLRAFKASGGNYLVTTVASFLTFIWFTEYLGVG